MKSSNSATILKPSEIEECYSKEDYSNYFKILNREPGDSAPIMGAVKCDSLLIGKPSAAPEARPKP